MNNITKQAFADAKNYSDFNSTFFDLFLNTGNNKEFYPPYNSWVDDNENFFIEFGVAGFKKENITITFDGVTLKIVGVKEKAENEDTKKYITRNLARRSFTRVFEIKGKHNLAEAKLLNGILTIRFENDIKTNIIDIVEE